MSLCPSPPSSSWQQNYSRVHDFQPIEAKIHVFRLAAQVAAFEILATQPNNKLGVRQLVRFTSSLSSGCFAGSQSNER